MEPKEFLIDLILPVSNRNENQEYLLCWGEGVVSFACNLIDFIVMTLIQ
jgi:hypothetical protein